jgi:hypothetical protein
MSGKADFYFSSVLMLLFHTCAKLTVKGRSRSSIETLDKNVWILSYRRDSVKFSGI